MENLIQIAATAHNDSPLDDNAWDGDLDSYYNVSVQQSGGGSVSNTIYSTHTFSVAYTIDKIVVKMYIHQWSSAGASANASNASCKVEVYRNGAWEDVTGSTDSVSGSGNSNSSDTVDVTLEDLDLEDVTLVRASVYVYARQDGDGGGQGADGKIYEIEAWADVGGGYSCII